MFALTRKRKIIIIIIIDIALITLACLTAYLFMQPYVGVAPNFVFTTALMSIALYLLFGRIFNVFTRINRYTNLREMSAIFFAITSQFIVSLIIVSFFWEGSYSRRFELLAYVLSLCLIIASRLIWRLLIERRNNYQKDCSGVIHRTLIIGAGEGGRILFNSLVGSPTSGEIDVVGFIDDDPNKQKTYLSGKKVLGPVE